MQSILCQAYLVDIPVILFLDGHGSHWNRNALKFLMDNKVFPFFLASHTSIWSQPMMLVWTKGFTGQSSNHVKSIDAQLMSQPFHTSTQISPMAGENSFELKGMVYDYFLLTMQPMHVSKLAFSHTICSQKLGMMLLRQLVMPNKLILEHITKFPSCRCTQVVPKWIWKIAWGYRRQWTQSAWPCCCKHLHNAHHE